MFNYLLLLFIIVPAIELGLLIKVGGVIGTANTVLLILLTGIGGASLARAQGFSVLRTIQSNLETGVMPTDSMIDGLFIFSGGVLLLTPGFITDILGFLFLIPFTRALIKTWTKAKFEQKVKAGNTLYSKSSADPFSGQNIEDADFH